MQLKCQRSGQLLARFNFTAVLGQDMLQICYGVLRYVIIYEKGYQYTDVVSGAVTMKLKGIGVTGVSQEPSPAGVGRRIWDTADYQIPPQVR